MALSFDLVKVSTWVPQSGAKEKMIPGPFSSVEGPEKTGVNGADASTGEEGKGIAVVTWEVGVERRKDGSPLPKGIGKFLKAWTLAEGVSVNNRRDGACESKTERLPGGVGDMPFFLEVWQTNGLRDGYFASVAGKGVRDELFVSVANAGVSGSASAVGEKVGAFRSNWN